MGHLISKFDTHFLRYSGCHRHGCHSTRLCTSNLHVSFSVALTEEEKGQQMCSMVPLGLSCNDLSEDLSLLPYHHGNKLKLLCAVKNQWKSKRQRLNSKYFQKLYVLVTQEKWLGKSGNSHHVIGNTHDAENAEKPLHL